MMNGDFEKRIIEVAKPYFEFCRDGDWEHARRVVDWVKEIGENRKDLKDIIIAAYIHDIGWYKVLPKGKIDFDEMLKHENVANQNSSKYVQEVLNKLDCSKKDVERILRLVRAADNHDANIEDEEIIVDADNLSKLCGGHFRQKYRPESYKKLINLFEKEYPDRIKTPKGKALYPGLLEKLKEEIFI